MRNPLVPAALVLSSACLLLVACSDLHDFDVQVREMIGTRGKTGRGQSGVATSALAPQPLLLIRAGAPFSLNMVLSAQGTSSQSSATPSGFAFATALPLTVKPFASTFGSIEIHGVTNLAVGDYVLTLSAPGYLPATRAIRVEPERFPTLPIPAGGATALAGDPAAPGFFLTETARGVYRTTNSGQSWSLVAGVFAGAKVATRGGLTLVTRTSQSQTNTVEVFRSLDQGITFTQLPSLVTTATGGGIFGSGIGLSANPLSQVYVGRGNQLFRLDPAAPAWTSVGSLPGEFIGQVLVDRTDANVLYVATAFGLYRSTDGGVTLTPIPPVTGTSSLNSLEQDETGRLWVAQGNALYRSDNGGSTWITQSPTAVTYVAVFGTQPATVAAVTSGALEFSNDDGATFTTRALPAGASNGRLFLASTSELLLVANPAGVYRSLDGGQTWAPANSGLRGISISALFAPSSGVLVLSTGLGYHRSTDGGQTWTPVTGLPAGKAVSMAELLGALYAVGNNGVYRSSDTGQSWSLLPGTPVGLVALTRGGTALYGAGRADVGGGSIQEVVMQSSDGSTWTVAATFTSPLNLGTLSSLGGSSTLIRGPASGGGPIQISGPGGASWLDRSSGVLDLQVGGEVLGHPSDSARGLALAGNSFALFETSDAGLSWTRLIEPSQLSPFTGRSLAYSPDGLTIWASGLEGGAARIRNGQLTLRGALGEFEKTQQVRVDPGNGQRVYLVGTYGVYASQTGGD